MKVKVYRNLTKKCWSVMDKKTRRVIQHLNILILKDCSFQISKSGQARVRRENKKYVHAFIEGMLITDVVSIGMENKKHIYTLNKGLSITDMISPNYEITYNPYEHNTFIYKENHKEVENYLNAIFFDSDGKVYSLKNIRKLK